MNSSSSPNSTENSSLMNLESIKDKALSLLKEETVDEKELLSFSKDLMMIPNLEDDIVPILEPLLDIDSFEIAHKSNLNPVFIRNLLNIIQIINFI